METTRLPWDSVAFRVLEGFAWPSMSQISPNSVTVGQGLLTAMHLSAFSQQRQHPALHHRRVFHPEQGRKCTRADTEQVTRAVPAALTKEGFGQGQGQEICSSHQLVLRLQARAQKRAACATDEPDHRIIETFQSEKTLTTTHSSNSGDACPQFC